MVWIKVMESATRQRRHEKTRRAILDAAGRIVARKGIQDLSMREIARQIDYSPAGLYEYFEGKEEIVQALCAEGHQQLSAYIRQVNEDLSPADYLTLHWALNSSLIKENYHLATNANRVLSQIRPHLSVQLEEEVRSAKEAVKFDLKQTGLPAKEMLFFAPLQTAIAGSNSVRLEYDSIESGLSLRNVDPYGLVFRRHAWYLVGFDHKSGEYRIFRLSRIKKLALKSQKFVRDQNFSLEKLFQDSWEVFTGQPMTVKIKFTGKAAKVVASGKRHPSEKVLIQKDGTLYYTARVAGLEEVSHWILSFGSEAEVLEPSELRSKFAQITREMQEIYSGRYSLVAEKRETYRVKGFKK